jgi:hypothetical protein
VRPGSAPSSGEPRSSCAEGRAESGFILVAAVGAVVLLGIVAAGTARHTLGTVRAIDAAVARERALLAAEGLLTATLFRLEHDAGDWLAPAAADPSLLSHGWRGLAAALDGVPGAAGPDEPEVRLEVTRAGAGPALRIRSEARVRGRARALEALVRPASVADRAWSSVHEVLDPEATGGDRRSCAVLRWATGLHDPDPSAPVEWDLASDLDRCRRVRFDTWVTVSGPLHVDDAMRASPGWVPDGPVSSAAPSIADGATSTGAGGQAGAGPNGPSWPQPAPPTLLPIDHLAAVGDLPTCRLRGPTLLRFDGDTVRVRSPRSHPDHDGGPAPAVACPGLDRTALTGIAILGPSAPDIIVVVRDPGARCAEHPLGIDPSEDDVREQRCGDGTAYVWGRYLGRRTVVAEDDVQIVWDVGPGTAGVAHDLEDSDALLGLVAGGSVVLRRPVTPPVRGAAPFGLDTAFAGPGIPPFGTWPEDAPTPTAVRWERPEVVAVIAALGGSLRVQNPRWGQPAVHPIRVTGAVAQRFRGPTGWERRDSTGALQAVTGAALDVRYDARLRLAVPPALPRLEQGRLRILDLREVGTGPVEGPAP